MNYRVRRLEQVHETTAGMIGDVVPLAYALNLNGWPIAPVVGILQLRMAIAFELVTNAARAS